MASAHQVSAACSSSVERELEFLRQQLSLKDALLESKEARLGEMRDAKDAVIEATDKLLAKFQEPLAQRLCDTSGSGDSCAGNADLAQRLAAAETRLQQLEAANTRSSKLCVGSGSSSSSTNSGSSSADAPIHVHQQKRARSSPHLAQALEEDEVLDHAFGFVGVKEWLYVGGVCRRWRGRYLSMCYKARASKEEHAFQTSHSSTFTTAARFSMALDNGLAMPDESQASAFFYLLPLLSLEPIVVLTLARVRGAAWHKDLYNDAAYYGDFELLKWLREAGCLWNTFIVAANAISCQNGQHALIVPWLLGIVDKWSQEDKNMLLFEAGIANNIASLKMLLDEGAELSSFIGDQMVNGESVHACWHFRAVAWALSNGCSWGVWRCQDLAPELYTDEGYRAEAISLFKWAHEHGCPCTCEATAADGAEVAA
jgi:hypothetical protein